MHDIVQVEVNCPECGNVNRRARRACKFCHRTGKVLKNVPVDKSDEELC